MRPKSYDILARAVEEGILYGLNRCMKYELIPDIRNDTLGTVQEKVAYAVMNAICEVFDFEEKALAPNDEEDRIPKMAKPADGELFAHAGTHYAALCRAVLDRGEEVERLRAALRSISSDRPKGAEPPQGGPDNGNFDDAYSAGFDRALWFQADVADAALRGKEGA